MDAVDRGNITPQVEKDYKYYMGTEYDTGDGPGDTPAENEGGLWENIKALGLGPVSASFVEELAQYGGIVEAKNGQLTWAPGWSASNYKSKLDHAKNGALPASTFGADKRRVKYNGTESACRGGAERAGGTKREGRECGGGLAALHRAAQSERDVTALPVFRAM